MKKVRVSGLIDNNGIEIFSYDFYTLDNLKCLYIQKEFGIVQINSFDKRFKSYADFKRNIITYLESNGQKIIKITFLKIEW